MANRKLKTVLGLGTAAVLGAVVGSKVKEKMMTEEQEKQNQYQYSYAPAVIEGTSLQEWEKYKADFLPLLKKFYAISLREKSFTEFLKTEWNISAVTVLDPVFLLNYEEWLEVGKESEIKIDTPYLLIYAFQTEDDIYDVARAIACKYGLQLVSISYKYEKRLSDIIQLTECGPKDFISLVYRAAFVCTSSFHGMAFSILFEKDFYCMGHPLYSQRNYDLLKMVGLEERLFYKKTDIQSIEKCDYSHVAERLDVEKKKSLEILRGSISH